MKSSCGSIFDSIYWRTGVILTDGKNKALVKADIYDKKIYIYILGEDNTKREFLSHIRRELEYIHKTIAKIDAKEMVPLPANVDFVMSYKALLNLEFLSTKSIKVLLYIPGP